MKGTIFMKRDFRDAALIALAIGTAYGLGVITCVAYEIKLCTEVFAAIKEEKRDK